LVSWLIWWQWSQFAWAGSAIDLQDTRHTRVLVLCLIPVALVNAVAIPTAFDGGGIWFGATYLGVLLLVSAAQGAAALRSEQTRVAFIRYTSIALIAPAVVLVGAFFDGHARTAFWVLAMVLDLAGALRAASAGEWTIDPVHFAERHALFVIIALGEVLVAVGATATSVGLTAATVAGLVVAVAVACVMWWTYFAFIPRVAEHRLRAAVGPERGRVARDIFTFGHFPIVVGLITYAVVAKHLVQHPTDHLETHDRWMLALSATSFVGGLLAVQFRAVRRLAPERVVAIVVSCAIAVTGRWLPGVVVVGAVAVVLFVMQAITVRRVSRLTAAPTAAAA
jgi:low temperature requirement protein LtrA